MVRILRVVALSGLIAAAATAGVQQLVVTDHGATREPAVLTRVVPTLSAPAPARPWRDRVPLLVAALLVLGGAPAVIRRSERATAIRVRFRPAAASALLRAPPLLLRPTH